MQNTQTRLWHSLRRSLARLFGSTAVRELSLEEIGSAVAIRHSKAMVWLPIVKARLEHIDTHVTRWAAPEALPGAGNSDLSNPLCSVSASSVPYLSPEGILGNNAVLTAVSLHAINIDQGSMDVKIADTVRTQITLSTVQALSVRIMPAAVHSVLLQLGNSRQTQMQENKRDDKTILPLRPPAIISRLSAGVRVPMTVRRIGMTADYTQPSSFALERQHLATANQMLTEETTLLACFPHVPLARVQQMAVIEEGAALRLWLRQETASAHASQKLGLATIIVGKHRSTGETLRAVLPDAVRTQNAPPKP